MGKKIYLVMGTADGIDWAVAAYGEEENCNAHVRAASRRSFELAKEFKGKFKDISVGANEFDPDMYSERDLAEYYKTEVEFGSFQVRPCESFNVGEVGQLPEASGVGVPVEVEGTGSKLPDGVREGGTSGVRGLLPERAESGEGHRSICALLEPIRRWISG